MDSWVHLLWGVLVMLAFAGGSLSLQDVLESFDMVLSGSKSYEESFSPLIVVTFVLRPLIFLPLGFLILYKKRREIFLFVIICLIGAILWDLGAFPTFALFLFPLDAIVYGAPLIGIIFILNPNFFKNFHLRKNKRRTCFKLLSLYNIF